MAVDTPKANSTQFLPDGRRKADVSKESPDEFREKGAILAVDMEEGTYQRDDGSLWTGPYSKREIAERLGWSRPGNGDSYPVWMAEPTFSNWVQYERIKRTFHARVSIDEAKPLLAIGAGALLLEVVKRALTAPESIGNRELFLEARRWLELLKDVDEKQDGNRDPRSIIDDFFKSLTRLPKNASARALLLFETDIDRTTAAAKRPKAIEAKKVS